MTVLPTLFALAQVAAATEGGWTDLDAELDELAAQLDAGHTGPELHGWLRTRWAASSDVDASALAGDQDLGGFDLDVARLVLSGEARPGFAYTLGVEAGNAAISDAATGGGTVALEDAFVSIQLARHAALSVGRFSSTVLWNTGVEERRLLFLDRSFLDETWDGRDVGLELSGWVGPFNGWLAAQNGSDGAGQDLALSARASVHLLGDALYAREGAAELAPDEQHLTLGVGWFDDRGQDDGDALAADVVFARGRWSAVGEVVGFGDDVGPTPTIDPATGVTIPAGASLAGSDTAWGVTLSCLLVPERWELAARWQELDDDADTRAASLALNRYLALHDAKWTLQLDTSDSDDPALEADTLAIGLTVGF